MRKHAAPGWRVTEVMAACLATVATVLTVEMVAPPGGSVTVAPEATVSTGARAAMAVRVGSIKVTVAAGVTAAQRSVLGAEAAMAVGAAMWVRVPNPASAE